MTFPIEQTHKRECFGICKIVLLLKWHLIVRRLFPVCQELTDIMTQWEAFPPAMSVIFLYLTIMFI